MEVCSEWEIYIPTEAEVKNIPLKSLPKSVVRRIGLPLSDIDSSRKPDSSDVIWICPAVIGRKGQGSASHKESDLAENAFLASDFQGGPLKMSFVSSNRTARDVLKNISAGKHSSNKEHLCQDSMQLANHNAVVVYKGQIYLCIRKARRGQQMTPELKSPTHAAIPSTSGLPSASFTKELIRGKRKIKADAGKVKHCEKADELKRKNDSAVRAENSAPRPPHSRHRAESKSQGNKAARKEFSEEPLRSSCTQPQENQKDPTNRVSREYEVNDLGEEEDSVCTNDLDCNQMDCQEDECNGSDGQMEPLGSTAQRDCDFNDLKQEEMIAHLKAKFMQDEAALSDLIRTAH
ncbi:uncharacterized protein si:dkeyp-110g5.4 isoform X2 [Fundulus heteroclitus]|nr:uncharacterized protein si:dkeyp-110g5.4 isoform X2 [Fundulus heteroclitus]